MKETKRRSSDLQTIPGVGPSIEEDLQELGFESVADLAHRDPEEMYQALCELRGQQDRCVLCVFRCATYYASRRKHDPERLKWWNWKDA